MVSLSRPLPFLYFCIRVLFFAIVAAPICAHSSEVGQIISEDSEPVGTDVSTGSSAFEASFVPGGLDAPGLEIPVPDGKESETENVAAHSPISEENLIPTGYWLASSRRALQTIHDQARGPWHLDVFQTLSDGSSRTANLNELSTQLVPGVPVCVFTHGSFVKWESNCRQACQASQNLRWATGNQPLQMIFFSWPSDGPYTHVPQVDVAVRGKRAEFNGFHLATLISHIPETCPVTIIGHSHGARVAMSAMELAAGGSIQGFSFTGSVGAQRRMRVVLAAGAMDHHWLNPGERYGLALNRVECLLNLQNQNDLPLAFYPLHRPFARRPIARAGLTEKDTATLGYNAAKIRQVDVTNVVGSAHFWPDYYSQSQILTTIAPYLVSY